MLSPPPPTTADDIGTPAVDNHLPKELHDRSDAVKAKIGFEPATLSFRNLYYFIPIPETVVQESKP